MSSVVFIANTANAKNQPIVEMLLTKAAARANRYAAAAYESAATKVAGANLDLFQDKGQQMHASPNWKWLKKNLGPKTSEAAYEFIALYPIKSEYERTGKLDALLPAQWRGTVMTESEYSLKKAIHVLMYPYNDGKTERSLIEHTLYDHYFGKNGDGGIYGIWNHRFWFAEQIENYLERKKEKEVWWAAALESDTMLQLNDFQEVAGPHHKLVIQVKYTNCEVIWWCCALPLKRDDGWPWDFSARTLNNPKSPGNDVIVVTLFALETTGA